MNDFLQFCIERESIREKKERGEPFPWTSDPILQRHKFTNINRNDDKGTVLLFNLVAKCKTLYDILKAVSVYRMSGSLNNHIFMMEKIPSNLWFSELKKSKKFFNQTAYQCNWPKGHDSARHFLTEVLESIIDEYYAKLMSCNNITILEGAKIMCDLFTKYKYKRMSFQATEICKDLAYLTPWIDKESECKLGPGALKGLKLIFNTPNPINMKQLLNCTNYNWSTLEHGLCEYSKYCEFKSGKRHKDTKLYKIAQ